MGEPDTVVGSGVIEVSADERGRLVDPDELHRELDTLLTSLGGER